MYEGEIRELRSTQCSGHINLLILKCVSIISKNVPLVSKTQEVVLQLKGSYD